MDSALEERPKSISWLWLSCKHRIGVFPGLWLLCALCVLLNATRKQSKSSLLLSQDDDYAWQATWRTLLSSALPIMMGALLLKRYARTAHKRKLRQLEATSALPPLLEPEPLPQVLYCTQTTGADIHEIDAMETDEDEDEVETVTIGVMTTGEAPELESMPPLSKAGCDKAMNTSHRPHSIGRPTGTPTNNASKRKIRRAQKSLEDVQGIIDAERRTKIKEWRSSLTKYRNKLLQMVRKNEDRSKLVGYVFTSRMASQRDVESTAVYVRSLKEELNHQCTQNEKMRNNIMRSRPRHLY